jgi:hypothetical protein
VGINKNCLLKENSMSEEKEISAAEIAMEERKARIAENPEAYAEQAISAAEIAVKQRRLKETSEFVIGSIALSKAVMAELHDGFQASDLINLARKISVDAEFRELLWEAAKGIPAIPQELKEADATEIALELGQIVLDSLRG